MPKEYTGNLVDRKTLQSLSANGAPTHSSPATSGAREARWSTIAGAICLWFLPVGALLVFLCLRYYSQLASAGDLETGAMLAAADRTQSALGAALIGRPDSSGAGSISPPRTLSVPGKAANYSNNSGLGDAEAGRRATVAVSSVQPDGSEPSLAPLPLLRMPFIEVAESPSCAVPRAPPPCTLRRGARIHLVFVSAMWNRESTTEEETGMMLKSLVLQTRCQLWLHFLVAGEPEISALPVMMADMGAREVVPRPPPLRPHEPLADPLDGYVNGTRVPAETAVLYSLHAIPITWVTDRAKALNLYPLQHHSGVAGMAKFFVADLLWQEKRAIYLDVDVVIGGDIQDLWVQLRAVKEDARLLYFMGDNLQGPALAPRWQPYCSAQLIMDLGRMRRVNLTRLLVRSLRGQPPSKLPDFRCGDQWLFTRVCQHYQGVCRILPAVWNVSGCSRGRPFLGLTGQGMEANGSCWRVLHFNCQNRWETNGTVFGVPLVWEETVKWVRSTGWNDLQKTDTKWSGESAAKVS